jgi:hypothetical protein
VYVSRYVAQLRESEAALAEALESLAEHHAGEPDVRSTAVLLASWSRQHAQSLAAVTERYKLREVREPPPSAATPFCEPHGGDGDLLLDLHQAWLLGQQVHLRWTVLGQVARALRDGEVSAMAGELGTETDRQLAWLQTRIVEVAPQALIIGP